MKHFNSIGAAILLGLGCLCHADPSLAQSQPAVAREYKYGFGAGIVGALQQDDFPLEFGQGLRAFFSFNELQKATFELAADATFDRQLADGMVFVFGNESNFFGFSKGHLINVDLAAKLAFRKRLRNSPYAMFNLGLAFFLATDGKAIDNSTFSVRDENMNVSGFYLGAGLGYKHYMTPRLFFDLSAIFDYVVIESAQGGDKSGELPESVKSPAEVFKLQFGYDF